MATQSKYCHKEGTGRKRKIIDILLPLPALPHSLSAPVHRQDPLLRCLWPDSRFRPPSREAKGLLRGC